jgi:hypothetical protein
MTSAYLAEKVDLIRLPSPEPSPLVDKIATNEEIRINSTDKFYLHYRHSKGCRVYSSECFLDVAFVQVRILY